MMARVNVAPGPERDWLTIDVVLNNESDTICYTGRYMFSGKLPKELKDILKSLTWAPLSGFEASRSIVRKTHGLVPLGSHKV